jgi:PAS domain-containing protein
VAQKDVELILMRQLASYLAMPVLLVDPTGNLLYYNEPAEALLASRYEETGEMSQEAWSALFRARDEDGKPLAASALPLVIALEKRQPTHSVFWIEGLDGVSRRIAVTALPLEGQQGRHLGAVGLFWETDA